MEKIEKKENLETKPMRLKDRNYFLKRNTPGAFEEEDEKIRKMIEDGADPWDFIREG